jgi:hypothetical protein
MQLRPFGTRRGTRVRSLSAFAMLALIGGMVGACASAASPVPASTTSPAATPTPAATTPAPTPSPTPDVAGAFVKQMIGTHAAMMVLTGTMSVSGIQGTLTGTYSFSGADAASTMTTSFGANEQVQDRVQLGTSAWTRSSPGPWLKEAKAPDPSKNLNAAFAKVLDVTDKGLETRNGTSLHHLVPKVATIPPEALNFDATVKNPTITMEFYADDSGKPEAMLLRGKWTQAVGGKDLPVTMDLEYRFTQWGGTVTVTEPTDVWTVYASKLGYSMAHPRDWTVALKSGQDAYALSGDDYVFVAPQAIPTALSTKGFHDGLLKTYRTQFGGNPDQDTTIQLGGQAGNRLVYHFKNASGQDVALFDYVTARRGTGWEVFLVTAAGDGEAADAALFESFVATFKFTK